MTTIYKTIDRICFHVVMLWPSAWPANAVADWMLSRAGRHAYGAPEKTQGMMK